jgi:hypothetical protein
MVDMKSGDTAMATRVQRARAVGRTWRRDVL